MEKYVETKTFIHKLCDSFHNFVDCQSNNKKDVLGKRLLCIIIIFILKGRKYELILGEICHTKQDYHLLDYSIQKTFRLNMAQ